MSLPTRVTAYLGGTGQDNSGRINVHPTLNKVTIGGDALPGANLEVRGNVFISGDVTIGGSTNISGSISYNSPWVEAGYQLSPVNVAANVGIGASATKAKFTVTGNAHVTSNISFGGQLIQNGTVLFDASGNLSPNRFNSGTNASINTFLRGDGTWGAVSGGGGGGGSSPWIEDSLKIYQVNTASKVGIGLTTPVATLHVSGNAYATTLEAATFKQYSNTLFDAASNLSNARWNSGSGASASTFLRGDGTWATPTTSIGSPWIEDSVLNMYMNNTTANVSIGSTTSKSKLSVSGNAFISGNLETTGTLKQGANTLFDLSSNMPVTRLDGGTNASSSTYWRGDGVWAVPAGGGGSGLSPWVESTTSNVYLVNTVSNVSIGGTSSASKLGVTGNVFISGNTNLIANLFIGNAGVWNYVGKLGVATNSPVANLHVVGNVYSSLGYFTPGNLVVADGTITSAGKLGVATLAPVANLHVVGNAHVTANISIGGNVHMVGGGIIHHSGNVGIGAAYVPSAAFPVSTLAVAGNAYIDADIEAGDDILAAIKQAQGIWSATGKLGVATLVPVANLHVLGNVFSSLGYASTAGNLWIAGTTIDTTGKLGVLTAAPVATAHITGNVFSTVGFATTTGNLRVSDGTHTSAGLVGIATLNPAANLHVVGNVHATANITAVGNLYVGVATGNPVKIVDETGKLQIGAFDGGTSASAVTFWRGDGTWASASGGSGLSPWIETVVSNVYLANTTSNVSIGSTSSRSKLEVTGNVYITGNTTVAANLFVADGVYNYRGKVGVATVNPVANLHVVGNAHVTANISVGGNLYMSGGGMFHHSGNVGIGAGYTPNAAFPQTTLIVGGNVHADGDIESDSNFYGAYKGSRGVWTAAGKVGVSTTSPGANLHVVGNTHVTANITAVGNLYVGVSGGNPIKIVDETGKLQIGAFDAGTSASAATFWRGDGTWGSVTGASPWNDDGVLRNVTLVNVTSNVSVGSTTTGIKSKLLVEGNVHTTSNLFAAGNAWFGIGSGRVGITTTAPAANLHVVGNVYASQGFATPGNLVVADGTHTSAGRVGIATLNPAANLQVTGNIHATANITAVGNVFVGTTPKKVIDQLGNLQIQAFNDGTSASTGTFWRGDGTWAALSGSGLSPWIETVVSNVYVANTTSNVSIGGVASRAKLTVEGNAHINGNLTVLTGNIFVSNAGVWNYVGKLGVATNAPVANLHVVGNTFSTVGFATTGNLVVADGTHTSAGRVGIATLNPAANLHVTGNIHATANIATGGNLFVADGVWTPAGRLGVATLSPGSANLFVSGNAHITTNVHIPTGNLFVSNLGVWNQVGKLGIATNSPVANLHVAGNIHATANITAVGNVFVGTTPKKVIDHNGNIQVAAINDGLSADTTTFLRGDMVWSPTSAIPGLPSPWNDDGVLRNVTLVNTAANVSIGSTTTAIKSKLLVGGNVHSTLGFATPGNLVVADGTHTSAGRVGIATLNPAANLQVTGNIHATANITAVGNVFVGTTPKKVIDQLGNLQIQAFNDATSASTSTFWRGDGTWSPISGSGLSPWNDDGVLKNISLVNTSANVSIGTTTTGIKSKLLVVGNIHSTSNIAATGNLFVGAAGVWTPIGGKIGVGTLSPAANVHVPNGNIFASVGFATTGNLVVADGTHTSAGRVGIATLNPAANLHVVGNVFSTVGFATTGNLVVADGTHTSAGKVGIATLAPAANLHVAGNVFATTIEVASSGSFKQGTNTLFDSNANLSNARWNSGTNANWRNYVRGDGTWSSPPGALYINVKDYGAVGDGVTDDTAAIQAALDVKGNSAVVSASGTGTVMTLNLAQPLYVPTGSSVVVSGCTPSGYNGTFTTLSWGLNGVGVANVTVSGSQTGTLTVSGQMSGLHAGKEVILPAGTYNLTSALNINVHNTTIRGAGRGATILKQTTANTKTIYASGMTQFHLYSLKIFYPNFNTGLNDVGVHISGGIYQFLRDVDIERANVAMQLTDSFNSVLINQCHFQNFSYAGLYMNTGENCFLQDCWALNDADSGYGRSGALLILGFNQGHSFTNFSTYGGTYAAILGSSGGTYPAFNRFRGCYFDYTTSGVYFYEARDTMFTDCWFSCKSSHGITLDTSILTRFVNCDFFGSAADGLSIGSSTTHTIATGCYFGRNQDAGVRIAANGTDFVVQNCVFTNNGPTGSLTQDNSVVVGAGTSDRYVIADNLLNTSTGGSTISDGGSGSNKRVENNY